MKERRAVTGERRHEFYDSRALVRGFCPAAFIAIVWQVSQFEGFQPIFSCARTKEVDRQVLSRGRKACLSNARSRSGREGCLRRVYVLTCMKERWR